MTWKSLIRWVSYYGIDNRISPKSNVEGQFYTVRNNIWILQSAVFKSEMSSQHHTKWVLDKTGNKLKIQGITKKFLQRKFIQMIRNKYLRGELYRNHMVISSMKIIIHIEWFGASLAYPTWDQVTNKSFGVAYISKLVKN